ncbi:MAG: hypothetical protein COC24_002065 [Alphaproteobacteria bacterium]|nr:hypothetical protein [Alphaproteobacteria bacterium]
MSFQAKPVSKGFNAAVRDKPLTAKISKVKPDIKTKSELDYRQKNRITPKPELNLTPPTHRLIAMRQQTAQTNEKRITQLRNSLGNASKNMRQQHQLSTLKGGTKPKSNNLNSQPRTR